MKKQMNSRMGMKKMSMDAEEKLDAVAEKGGKKAPAARKKDMAFHKKYGADE